MSLKDSGSGGKKKPKKKKKGKKGKGADVKGKTKADEDEEDPEEQAGVDEAEDRDQAHLENEEAVVDETGQVDAEEMEEGQLEEQPEEQEEQEEQEDVDQTAAGHRNPQSKQQQAKGKAKRKGKGKAKNQDIDEIIREINQKPGQTNSSKMQEGGQATKKATAPTSESLLMGQFFCTENRYFDATAEIKKLFGSRIVNAEEGKKKGRGAKLTRRYALVQPQDSWLYSDKTGFHMDLVDTEAGISTFKFVHPRQYQEAQYNFLDSVESLDPNNISSILRIVSSPPLFLAIFHYGLCLFVCFFSTRFTLTRCWSYPSTSCIRVMGRPPRPFSRGRCSAVSAAFIPSST